MSMLLRVRELHGITAANRTTRVEKLHLDQHL